MFSRQILFWPKMHIYEPQLLFNSMNQNTKDIISGFVSGWTQVLIMQPFQLVKIRLQTQSTSNPYYNGMTDCFQKILKEEGLTSFYKGTVTPLIGIGFQASAMFFTYEFSKRLFSRLKENPNQRLSLKYVFMSGLISSLPTSLVASPVEHARIRIQIQKPGFQIYNGSVDAGIKIARQFSLTGLYRGFFATWCRQAVGQATFFVAYESTLRACVRKDQSVSEAPLIVSLLGGALAGIVFFSFAYPFDYMKTLMQTDNLQQLKYKSMRDVFLQRMRAEGVKTFYKGIGVTLARAATVNAGGFLAFETSMRMLGRNDHE